MKPCALIHEQVGALFQCRPHQDGYRITTPFVYPDGDVIDVFWVERGGHSYLTDYGESLRWLSAQGSARNRTARQKLAIQETCSVHGVDQVEGMLVVRVAEAGQVAQLAIQLAQACIGVASLVHTLRQRFTVPVLDEVEEILRELTSVKIERSKEYRGDSGRQYVLDFVLEQDEQLSALHVLSTGSRAATRNIVDHTFTMWSDLKRGDSLPSGTRCISLIDDSLDVWTEGDLKLINQASDGVVFLTKPDDVRALLAAA